MYARVLGEHSRKSVMVAYLLSRWPGMQGLDDAMRIKVRYLFEIFASGLISVDQLCSICNKLHPEMEDAAKLLVPCERCTVHDIVFGVNPMNEIHTTLLLLASVGTIMWDDVCAYLWRTSNQCLDRIRYVISCLEHEQTCHNSRPKPYEIVHLDSVQIIPARRYDSSIMKAQLMREHRKRQTEMMKARMNQVRMQKRIKNLERIVEEYEREQASDDEEELAEEEDQSVSPDVIEEMYRLRQISSNSRRYSQKLLSFSQLLMLTSRKAYVLLRQVLPLPCLSCLKYHFADRLSALRKMLTSPDMIDEHITKLLKNATSDAVHVTLAVDAFAFQTFHETRTLRSSTCSDTFSNAFVFMCLPWDAKLRPAVVHIAIKENGSFDSRIVGLLHSIASRYRSKGIKVLFAATDGDRFLSSSHDSFFEQYVSEYKHDFSFLIGEIYQALHDKSEMMPIADPLHFAKNLRGKLLDHFVAVMKDKELLLTSASLLSNVIDLGQVLNDTSTLGRMRDFYVTSLFTLENVVKLMQAQQYHSALLFLPYSCIFTVLYASNLAPQTRLFLVKLSYTCFCTLMNESSNMVKTETTVKYRYGKRVSAVAFAEPTYVKRMLHTCLALGIAINFGPEKTRLDAVGTHLVENSIGIARSVSNSSQFDRILSAFANAEMRKDLAEELALQLYISHRINDGGAKIEPNVTTGVACPSRWDVQDIVSMFCEACCSEVKEVSMREMVQFQQELQLFTDEIELRNMTVPSPVANCSIMQRNIHYCSLSKSDIATQE